MNYVADKDEYGFWYVRKEEEMRRDISLRDWDVLLSADSYEDGGEEVAKRIAHMLSTRSPQQKHLQELVEELEEQITHYNNQTIIINKEEAQLIINLIKEKTK